MRRGLIVVGWILLSGCRFGFGLSELAADSDGGGPGADAAEQDGGASDSLDASTDAAQGTATNVVSGETTPAAASEEVTISPVVFSESFVTCSRRSSSSGPDQNLGRCQLLDGDTLRLASAAFDSTAHFSWSVVDVPGAHVQRGTQGFGPLQELVTISLPATVDRTHAFVLVTNSATTSATDNDEETVFLAELSSDTTLTVSRGASGEAATVDWQVIELPGASVQSGTTTMAIDALVSSATLPTSVDTTRSFVTYSIRVDPDVDGAEAVFKTRSELGPSSIQFTRQSNGWPLRLSWFAVELPLGSKVTTVQGQTVAPHTQLVTNIANSEIGENAFALTTVEIASGTSRTELSSTSATSTVGIGTLRIERNVGSGNPGFYRTEIVEIAPP